MSNKINLEKTDKEILGEIPIQFAQATNKLSLGRWDPKIRRWRFSKTPNAASTLLHTFRKYISYVDEEIVKLAKKEEEIKEAKKATDLPDIPKQNLPAWTHQRQA